MSTPETNLVHEVNNIIRAFYRLSFDGSLEHIPAALLRRDKNPYYIEVDSKIPTGCNEAGLKVLLMTNCIHHSHQQWESPS